MTGPERRTQVKSATRVLDILEALARRPEGHTFGDLLKLLELPKSSLHELLAVLTERGYVAADPQGRRYTLAIRAWELGQSYVRHRELVTEARPAMEDIVGFLNETAQLAILDGIENVYIAKVDCQHPLRLQSEVGGRLPAYATGLGKVLLAHLPSEELAARLHGRQLTAFTPNTVTEPGELLRELATSRVRGFGTDREEYTPGILCVAVPIRDHRGVAAAMSVSVPTFRATPELLATALRLLARASIDVSRRLGCPAEDAVVSRLLLLPEVELVAMMTEEFGLAPGGSAGIAG